MPPDALMPPELVVPPAAVAPPRPASLLLVEFEELDGLLPHADVVSTAPTNILSETNSVVEIRLFRGIFFDPFAKRAHRVSVPV